MIIAGVLLLVAGLLFYVGLMWSVGVVVVVVGLVLMLLGWRERAMPGRRNYY